MAYFSPNRHSTGRQSGKAVINLLLMLITIVVLIVGYKYLQKNNQLNFSTSSIMNPIKKINPFKDDFGGYGVQVIATTSLAEGKRVMNKFAQDGYSAFIIETSRRGSPLYLVRLGPYTRAEAIAVNDKIKRRYQRSPYVRDSFVAYRDE